MITVDVQPENETLEFGSLNTVLQLLNRLDLRPTEALVIRDGKLLTADRKLHQGDALVVKKVISAG
jgi:sulfur carrier protein